MENGRKSTLGSTPESTSVSESAPKSTRESTFRSFSSGLSGRSTDTQHNMPELQTGSIGLCTVMSHIMEVLIPHAMVTQCLWLIVTGWPLQNLGS